MASVFISCSNKKMNRRWQPGTGHDEVRAWAEDNLFFSRKKVEVGESKMRALSSWLIALVIASDIPRKSSRACALVL